MGSHTEQPEASHMTRTGTLWALLFFASAAGACNRAPDQAGSAEPTANAQQTARAKQQEDEGPLASMPPPEPKRAVEKPREEPAEPDPAAFEEHPGLRNPAHAREQAPERYTVVLTTTKGDITIDVRRSWAPLGADRFYNLVKVGAYNEAAFFRVIDGFMAQVGLHGDPDVNRIWRSQRIPDDPVTQSNTRGMVSFATSGKNARVNQFFINTGNNARLDAMGFAPFGRAREMDVVDQLYAGYGEGAPAGRGPRQQRIQLEGNAYLKREFPMLDYIRFARVVKEVRQPPPVPKRVSQ
jgi:peptidyl-prolyl cis-trans isomerase A (cyclophilin A)